MTSARRTFAVTAVLLLAAACCMQLRGAYSGDKTWLLFAAEQWLSGKRLYADIVEVNPPLIVWLYSLPVWLSRHTGLPDEQWLGISGILMSAVSAALCARLMRLHPAFAPRPDHRRALAGFLGAIFLLFTSPLYFFDREHILLVTAFPYLLRFMPSLAAAKPSARLSLGIGLCAGLACCIKPYALVLFAAVPLLALARGQVRAVLLSRENGVVYGCVAAYLLSIGVFAPEYLRDVLPMALATYWAFSRRLMGLFYGCLAFLMAGVSLADFRRRDWSPYRGDALYLMGIAAACLVYALINNGWGYTYHPLLCALLFLSGWLCLHYRWLAAAPGAERRFTFGLRACLLVIGLNAAYSLYILTAFFFTPLCEWSAECAKNQPYARYLEEHRVHSFGALTEDFHKWAALSRMTGAMLATRYNALWMVPALAQDPPRLVPRDRAITEQVGRDLGQDLDRNRPDIVFVDDARNFFGTGKPLFLPDFFISVPAFARAWSHYAYADRIDRCGAGRPPAGCSHSIYRRLP